MSFCTLHGCFADDIKAVAYFTVFFSFYKNERYHTRIGMVTPVQRHTGDDKVIIERRNKSLHEARLKRISKNRLQKTQKPLSSPSAVV